MHDGEKLIKQLKAGSDGICPHGGEVFHANRAALNIGRAAAFGSPGWIIYGTHRSQHPPVSIAVPNFHLVRVVCAAITVKLASFLF